MGLSLGAALSIQAAQNYGPRDPTVVHHCQKAATNCRPLAGFPGMLGVLLPQAILLTVRTLHSTADTIQAILPEFLGCTEHMDSLGCCLRMGVQCTIPNRGGIFSKRSFIEKYSTIQRSLVGRLVPVARIRTGYGTLGPVLPYWDSSKGSIRPFKAYSPVLVGSSGSA